MAVEERFQQGYGDDVEPSAYREREAF